MSLAVITDPDWGWLTVRIRWKEHLPRYLGQAAWYDLEDYHGLESRTPYFRRLKWLRSALEGRRAAKQAYADGHKKILVATLQYAPLFPLYRDVKYFVYGDATPRQYDQLYSGELDDRARKRWLRHKLTRLATAGHHMLCMSPWYRDGLIAGYGVRPEQATIVRPPIDTSVWHPKLREDRSVLNVVFIGGDFARKGGDILLEVAADLRFAACRCHFITKHYCPDAENCRFYPGLTTDMPEMRELVASCDLMVLPTRADCSPHVAIEAGAAGIPTIITDVGGVSDIVENGVNGTLLAKPDRCGLEDALLEYMSDPARIELEGAQARRRVEERNSVPVHMGILEELLA